MPSSSQSGDSAFDLVSVASSSSSLYTPHPLPNRKRALAALRGNGAINPKDLVGKTIIRVRKSVLHPALTLDFSDNTTFQVLIEGYNPNYPGIPKSFEMDSALEPIFSSPTGQTAEVRLKVVGCAIVTLTDKAFEINQRETRWDQNHSAIAFKFEGDRKWHCVWATLAEHDVRGGRCVFRSYTDVYLQQLHRSPSKPNHQRKNSRPGWR